MIKNVKNLNLYTHDETCSITLVEASRIFFIMFPAPSFIIPNIFFPSLTFELPGGTFELDICDLAWTLVCDGVVCDDVTGLGWTLILLCVLTGVIGNGFVVGGCGLAGSALDFGVPSSII